MTCPLRSAALWIALAFPCACETEPPVCERQPGYVCPVAGTGELGFNRDGMAPGETDLFLLSSVRRGPDDRIWLMDFNNQRMRVIDDDGLVRTVVGNGFHAIATTEIPAEQTPLENPIDFDFAPDGRLVFVSYHDPRVLALGDDGTLHTIAGAADGVLGMLGNEGDGGPAIDALFIQPDGIAIAPDGAIYVSDSLANRVRRIADGTIETVAGNGMQDWTGDGGPGVDAAVHWPSAIALDADGSLYIAQTRSHVVRRLAADGTIATVAGTGTQGYAGDGGAATAATLNQPYGLAIAGDGTLYIADRGNFGIRRVAPDGTIDTIAGTGREGLSGDGGPALQAEFGYLARLSLDGDSLLVADQSNSVARRIVLR